MTYEEAVIWLRKQPEHQEIVHSSYLGPDLLDTSMRFQLSEEMIEVAHLLRLNTRKRLAIADVGCGNGIAATAMAAFGHRVFAIDPDPSEEVGLGAAARLASARNYANLEFITAFAESIPLADNSLDCVYARQALHHFADLKKGVLEIARVLKPGGLFLASREHVVSDEKELATFLQNHVMQPLHGSENAYRLDEYVRALEDGGFQLSAAMGRFDNIINYYPGTESERISDLVNFARAKKGRLAGYLVKYFRPAQRKVANLLSKHDRHPGRLYSFLAVKRG